MERREGREGLSLYAQIRKLLDLFEGAHGRKAETVEELEKWLGSPEGRAATAYGHDTKGKMIPDF